MNLLLFCLLCLALLLSSNSSSHAATSPKPNVVILLADDLGWSDISHHPGGSIKTPNIDRLFKQGVELRQFMGWCVCSPTRAMLLTSRHPFRVGTGPEVNGELAKEETTLAEAFKANGYKTGVFGKWHNGEDPDTPEFHRAFDEAWKAEPQRKYVATGIGVNEHGFDEAWIYYGGGPDYFARRAPKTNAGPPRWWHNREHRPQDTGYTQDLITQHATEFIREHRSEPFFCYVPFQIVHEPYQAKESDLAKVDFSITDPTARSYAAMVQALDQSVADILAELDKNGLRENTIVVFSSDNGATKAGCNLPLRGGKHSLFEGGIRLPTAIHWPNGGLTGGTPWDGFCGALDLFPTLISMIDGEMPKTRPLDGKDLWPALKTRGQSPVESYYFVWHGQDVLRTPQWKLHRGMERFELYDVQSDESETTNVAATHPDVVKVLTAKMDAWVDSLGAALSHRPAPLKYHAVPAAEGDVLEVTVTVTPKATAKDQLVIPIATWVGFLEATDWVEFDIATATDSLREGFFYSPFKNNPSGTTDVLFRPRNCLDQYGREQALGPPNQGKTGTWEHRIIGLCTAAPGPLGQHGLVFTGAKAGTFKVYLDNLRLRRLDGSTSPIWINAKDTRIKKIKDTTAFTGISVRSVSASALQ